MAMRILQIASGDFFSTYGGGQVYVKNLVDEMIRQNLDVAVVSLIRNGNCDIIEKNYKNSQLIEINSEFNLEEAIKLLHPDIIHAHSLKKQACMIGRNLNIPVIVTAHHGGIVCPAGSCINKNDEICTATVTHINCLPCVLRNSRGGKLIYPIIKIIPEKFFISLGRRLSRIPFIPFITPYGSSALYIKDKKDEWHTIATLCTLLIAPSYKIGEALLANGLPAEKLRIIPHGVPVPALHPKTKTDRNGNLNFYYTGRICYIKGIHVLLKAFANINQNNIRLHIIGSSGNEHERKYMLKLQKEYAYDSRIIWHGKILPEDIYNRTVDFHICVSPTICLEVYGLNIAEALALGKPVLATRCGGAEMQVIDGKNGWLVAPNDVQALENKIREIAAHPEVSDSMRHNCQANTITNHVKILSDTYLTLRYK